MAADRNPLDRVLDDVSHVFQRPHSRDRQRLVPEEVGRIVSVGQGIAHVVGLPGVQSNELLHLSDNLYGLAFNLDPNEIGVILLDHPEGLKAGDEVRRTQRVLDIPVGESLLGRVIDGIGRPLDGQGPIHASRRLPVERPAHAIMERAPVTVPLQTGIKVIDALIPVGRGQRELILGDRQTGKTAIAVDTIINQRNHGVLCIYCAIGQRSTSVARVIDDLRRFNALTYTTVVATTEDHPPGEQYVAPYAAMSMAEHLMHQGKEVLVVLDDLTRHARAYRELSLLLRRPPGREAFPGDIFYLHSRLLERSTHLRPEFGGGSITALPIVETEAQNLSAYIPTNLISITDGQVYLSPDLFDKGILPAVDVGKSVSRVGGKTQLRAFRREAGDLRLSYSQFEELESFARFGTRLDAATLHVIERGRKVREIFKQKQYEPMPAASQIAILTSVNEGLLDDLPASQLADLEDSIRNFIGKKIPEVVARIESGEALTGEERDRLIDFLKQTIQVARSGQRNAPKDAPEKHHGVD